MAEALRVAVIGLGSMGVNHARVLRELPGAQLVAVSDLDEGRLDAGSFGAARYIDFREMIERERLDAVSVAVPTLQHLGVALACIERRLPLLVEKPMAAGLKECLSLREAAAERGVPLMVGHVERFNPALRELKSRLVQGQVAQPSVVWVVRVGPFFERGRDIGVVHDLATHDIDVLRWLLDSEVEEVRAQTQTGLRTSFEDALCAELRFGNGCRANLKVDWISDVKERRVTMMTGGGLVMVDTLRQELRTYDRPGPAVPSDAKPTDVTALPGAGEAPLRAELEAFLRVAKGELASPVTADDAIAAMRVVEALVESARTCGPVHIAGGGVP